MMKRIFRSIVLTVALLAALAISAEEVRAQKIAGVVYDTNKNNPMVGATVIVKGTKTATITDEEGKFSLQAARGSVLSISFLGYLTEEVKVTEAKRYSIVLKQDPELLDEVVVTALGLKREKRSLGYAATDVSGEALTAVQSSNWVSNSESDPLEISKKRLNSLSLCLPCPSAILDGIEIAARRI